MLEPNLNAIEPDQHATARPLGARGIYRRRVMRPLVFAVPVALLSLLTACGDSGTPAASGSAPAAAGSVLTGTVGQGDAPVITLVDSAGAPVTSLKAGSYTVNVKDLSTHHNFHLTGTGVDQKTTVPDTKDATWTVKLVAGTYTFKCDPHAAKMVGTFTVT
jgi:hypothetical protein